MKRVYLFCSGGMSTSILASKMQELANSHKIPIEIAAFPDNKIGQIIEEKQPNVILLGPQVKYRYKEIVKQYASTGIPIQIIDQTDYGMMNSEKVLKFAIKLLKDAKQSEQSS
ncbi:PTS sugar transporter subunit IIB [Clostridia bacterium]|nr:PTS sugar transporter subunit IIB [Clostridia bacterium]